MKLASCKSALNPSVVYSTERSMAVVPVLILPFCCFVIYSTRRFVLSFAWCYFVLVFFSPLSIAITSLWEQRANLSVFVCLLNLRLFGFVCFFFITKTCLYNVDPFKPHFCIVKVGFTGVYIIFLISAQDIDCGYWLEPPRRGGSNEYPQSMFLSRNKKNIRIFI